MGSTAPIGNADVRVGQSVPCLHRHFAKVEAQTADAAASNTVNLTGGKINLLRLSTEFGGAWSSAVNIPARRASADTVDAESKYASDGVTTSQHSLLTWVVGHLQNILLTASTVMATTNQATAAGLQSNSS